MKSITGYICQTAVLWDEGHNFHQELPFEIREMSILPFNHDVLVVSLEKHCMSVEAPGRGFSTTRGNRTFSFISSFALLACVCSSVVVYACAQAPGSLGHS